ncbi:Arginase/deacetylase [Glarea lozoyensis ATCC 20868]|uniref:Arginase/deacetylase n=1 Tax=Glarea lozoyensis (strain ATCC 20868 / MF5171) TaxID=1116229 RepID=S3DFD7_GLAL2|nr:Arginase/deacetylase [Glarea lozoyensis ATCC 20868]EPE35799.1 Arginase/deacetylase [Glarea lozoyensis ATCC 20868]
MCSFTLAFFSLYVLSLIKPVQCWWGSEHVQSEPPFNRKSDVTREEDLKLRWEFDWSFGGISTFAHLPHVKCLTNPDVGYDVAIIGVPFDTAVSYRPGE